MNVKIGGDFLSDDIASFTNRNRGSRIDNGRDPALPDAIWQREMERVQISDWLGHRSVVAPQAAVTMIGATGVQTGSAHVVSMAPCMELAKTGAIASALTRTGGSFSAVSVRAADVGVDVGQYDSAAAARKTSVLQDALTQLTLILNRSRSTRALVESAGQSRLEQSVTLAVASNAAAIRCTVEWSGDDVRLWFGIDRQNPLSVAGVRSLLTQCRSMLAFQGVRILSVMVNGQHLDAPENDNLIEPVLRSYDKSSGAVRFPNCPYSYFSRQETS